MRLLVAANGLLLLSIAAAVLAVQGLDRGSPAVDAAVRRYAQSVTRQRLQDAAGEIAPSTRGQWEPWIASQLGNIYEITGLAVRHPSLLARLTTGAAPGPTEVTVILDLNRGYREFYQPTTRVRVLFEEGRWYLAEPLLAPETSASAPSG